ncbi:uncharacterized protein CBL_01923 [Carabus blaptoides fortunei]
MPGVYMIFLPIQLSVLLALATTLATSQLLNFKDGNVGVNFGGYSASAGLGGFLTGDLAKGGLHAEAGTPFGQAAGAGLGGHIANDGTSRGGLYAGATAGGGVSAGAGLGGTATKTGSVGIIEAGAGGKAVVKTSQYTPSIPLEPVLVEKVPATKYIEKHVEIGPGVVEKVVSTAHPAPVAVVQEDIPVTYQLRKTYARRPHHHRKQAYFNAGLSAGTNFGGYQEVVPVTQKVKVVEKTYVQPAPPPIVVQKYVAPAPAPVVINKYGPPRGGFLTRLFAGVNVGGETPPAVIPPPSGAGGEVVKKATTTYSANASVNKNANLINDIFNIPISTLTAVNQLVAYFYICSRGRKHSWSCLQTLILFLILSLNRIKGSSFETNF